MTLETETAFEWRLDMINTLQIVQTTRHGDTGLIEIVKILLSGNDLADLLIALQGKTFDIGTVRCEGVRVESVTVDIPK
jgi:hypothetical protein